MFEEVEKMGESDLGKRLLATLVSLVLHVALVLVVIVVPLWYFDVLPESELAVEESVAIRRELGVRGELAMSLGSLCQHQRALAEAEVEPGEITRRLELSREAIRLAEEGFPVHRIMLRNLDLSLIERIGFTLLMPYNAKVYLRGEWWRPLHHKDRFVRPDLAATLRAMGEAERRCREGGADRETCLSVVRDYFYRGPVADSILTEAGLSFVTRVCLPSLSMRTGSPHTARSWW